MLLCPFPSARLSPQEHSANGTCAGKGPGAPGTEESQASPLGKLHLPVLWKQHRLSLRCLPKVPISTKEGQGGRSRKAVTAYTWRPLLHFSAFCSPLEAQGEIRAFWASTRYVWPLCSQVSHCSVPRAPQCPDMKRVMPIPPQKPAYFSGHASLWCTSKPWPPLLSKQDPTLLPEQRQNRPTQHPAALQRGRCNARELLSPARSSQREQHLEWWPSQRAA